MLPLPLSLPLPLPPSFPPTQGNTISTGELAFAHILALARNIPQASAALKAGRWDRALYTGSELSGKTVGIIGTGERSLWSLSLCLYVCACACTLP